MFRAVVEILVVGSPSGHFIDGMDSISLTIQLSPCPVS